MFHLFYDYQPYQDIYSHRKLHSRGKLSCLSLVTLFWAKLFSSLHVYMISQTGWFQRNVNWSVLSMGVRGGWYAFKSRVVGMLSNQGWLVCFQITRRVSCYQGKETEMKRVGLAALGAPGSSAAWLSVFHCKLKLLAWTKHCEAAHCLPLTPTHKYFTYKWQNGK